MTASSTSARLDRSEALLTATGRLISNAATFASFALLVRVLSYPQYAQLGLILGLQSFVHSILVAPAITLAQREVWAWHARGDLAQNSGYLVVGVSLVYLVSSIVIILGAAGLGWVEPGALAGVLAGAVVGAVAEGITTLFLIAWILREHRAFSTHAVLDSLSRMAALGALALLGVEGAWVYFLGMAAAGAAGGLVAYRLGVRRLRPHGLSITSLVHAFAAGKGRDIGAVLRGSLSLRSSTLLSWMVTTGNRYIIEPFVPRATLGSFLAAWGLGLAVLNVLSSLYYAAIMPAMYQSTSGEGDTPARRRTENGFFLSTFVAVIVPLVVTLAGPADHLAAVVLGGSTEITVPVLRAGLVFAVLHTLLGTMTNVALVERKPRYVAIAMGTAFALGSTTLVVLMQRYGVANGVWGLVFGSGVGLVLSMLLLRRALDLRPLARLAGSVVLATSFCSALAWGAFGFMQAKGLAPFWRVPAWGLVGACWAAWLWFDVRPRLGRLRSESEARLSVASSPLGPVAGPQAPGA